MSPNIRRHKVNKIRLGLRITQAAAHVSSAESEEGEEREKMRRTWYRTPVARHAPLSDGHCPSRPKTTKRDESENECFERRLARRDARDLEARGKKSSE